MTETLFEPLETGPSLGSGFLQLFLAYCATYGFLALVSSVIKGPDSPTSALIEYLSIAIAAIASAFLICLLSPRASREGRWVGTVPITLELAILLFEGGTTPLRELFYVGPEEGEAAWVIVLFTFPAWGGLCYSAMMWRLYRRRSIARA